jgi:hypothetical protein
MRLLFIVKMLYALGVKSVKLIRSSKLSINLQEAPPAPALWELPDEEEKGGVGRAKPAQHPHSFPFFMAIPNDPHLRAS